MSEPVVAAPSVVRGFYGKLPARGDFLRSGLPRSFTDKWDDWLQAGIAASRGTLGEAWQDAWMQAPIWRFALPDGQCGPAAMLGVWMPSVDRAGRYFPLTLALLRPGGDPDDLAARGTAWLDAAEQTGLDALEQLLAPDELMARLGAAPLPQELGTGLATGEGIWWTAGSPLVRQTSMRLAALPNSARFAAMIRDLDETDIKDPDETAAQTGCVEAS